MAVNEQTPLEAAFQMNPLRMLSCTNASRITGIDRHVIAAAMNEWTVTKGRTGLRFATPCDKRRFTSVQALRDWYGAMERRAACGY